MWCSIQIATYRSSVTKLGDFWKFKVSNYYSKVAQMFGDFGGILKQQNLGKNFRGYFLLIL